MDKIRSEALKIVGKSFTVKEVYDELDRRSRIYTQAKRNLLEIPQYEKYVDEIMPSPDEEFERRLKAFYDQIIRSMEV